MKTLNRTQEEKVKFTVTSSSNDGPHKTNDTTNTQTPKPRPAEPDVLKSLLDDLEDKIDGNLQNYKRLSRGKTGRNQDPQKVTSSNFDTKNQPTGFSGIRTTKVINTVTYETKGDPGFKRTTNLISKNTSSRTNVTDVSSSKNLVDSSTYTNLRTTKNVVVKKDFKAETLEEQNRLRDLTTSKQLDKSGDLLLSRSGSEDKKHRQGNFTKEDNKSGKKLNAVLNPNPKNVPELGNSKLLHKSQEETFDFDDVNKIKKYGDPRGSQRKNGSFRSNGSNKDIPVLSNSQIMKYQKEEFKYNAKRPKDQRVFGKSPNGDLNEDDFDEEFDKFQAERDKNKERNSTSIAIRGPGGLGDGDQRKLTFATSPSAYNPNAFKKTSNAEQYRKESEPTYTYTFKPYAHSFGGDYSKKAVPEEINEEGDNNSHKTIKRSLNNSSRDLNQLKDFYHFNPETKNYSESFYEKKGMMVLNQGPATEDISNLKRMIEELKNANAQLISQNNQLNTDLLFTKNREQGLEKKNEYQNKKLNRMIPENTDLNSAEGKRQFYESKLAQIEIRLGNASSYEDGSVIHRIVRRNIEHSGINKDEVDYLIDLKSRVELIEHSKPITVLEASQTIPNKF